MSNLDTLICRRLPLSEADPHEGSRKALEISAYYSASRRNMFTGEKDDGGVYVTFWPVDIARGSVTRTLFDKRGWRILFMPMKRRNTPMFNRIRAALEPEVDGLLPLWVQDDRDAIKARLTALRARILGPQSAAV
jgi:hypothetical protein